MAAALLAADYVLSPIELEAYSIQGIKQIVTTIANLRKANPKLKFLGMVPSKVDARNPRHGRHLQELERAYPQLMIPTGVGLRSSIADALASRVPVWKIKKDRRPQGHARNPRIGHPRFREDGDDTMTAAATHPATTVQEEARGGATGVRAGPGEHWRSFRPSQPVRNRREKFPAAGIAPRT
jgi:hypothetical protein